MEVFVGIGFLLIAAVAAILLVLDRVRAQESKAHFNLVEARLDEHDERLGRLFEERGYATKQGRRYHT